MFNRNQISTILLSAVLTVLTQTAFAEPKPVEMSFGAIGTLNGTASLTVTATGLDANTNKITGTMRRDYRGMYLVGITSKLGLFANAANNTSLTPFANFLLGKSLTNPLRYGYVTSLSQNPTSYPRSYAAVLLHARDAALVSSLAPMRFDASIALAAVITLDSATQATAIFYDQNGAQIGDAVVYTGVNGASFSSGKLNAKTSGSRTNSVPTKFAFHCAGNNGCIASDGNSNAAYWAMIPQASVGTYLSANASNAFSGSLSHYTSNTAQTNKEFFATSTGGDGKNLNLFSITDVTNPIGTAASHSSIVFGDLDSPAVGLAKYTFTLPGYDPVSGICAIGTPFAACAGPNPMATNRAGLFTLLAPPTITAVATLTKPATEYHLANGTKTYVFKNLTGKAVTLSTSGLSGVLSATLSGVGGVCGATVAPFASCNINLVSSGSTRDFNTSPQTMTVTYAGDRTLTSSGIYYNIGLTGITVPNYSGTVGTTSAMTITGTYVGGSTANITNAVSLNSSDRNVISISGTTASRDLAGTTTITAQWPPGGNAVSGSQAATVSAGEAVNRVLAVSSNGAVGLSWNNPSNFGRLSVSYERDDGTATPLPCNGDNVVDGTTNSISISGLSNGTTYKFTIWNYDGGQCNAQYTNATATPSDIVAEEEAAP